MSRGQARGGWSPLGWLVFPMVPAVLGRTYHETFNFAFSQQGGPDPHDWSWFAWVLLAGPLLGYGFLAGATMDVADPPGRRGPWSWLCRRAVWVAIGPWGGFLVGAGLWYGLAEAIELLEWAVPGARGAIVARLPRWEGAGAGGVLSWAAIVAGVVTLAYGWLLVALAAVRRARRAGKGRRAFRRGLVAALGFVGSLFGSFWAVTEAWRSYFFDARIVPVVAAAMSLALLSGCGSITYGELRRRELFAAMLTSWLLGMALAWRWLSRDREG